MKISIEYDGCLWAHMGLFRTLAHALEVHQEDWLRVQVGILTAHRQQLERDDLQLMVDRGFPRPDFWIGREGTDERHPSEFKAAVILAEGIDYHFDSCDGGDPLSVGLFQKGLGEEFWRLVRMDAREPIEVHHE